MENKYSINSKIGRLTILEFLHTDHARKRLVRCLCECSIEIITRVGNLGRKTNSCGCLKADLISQRMGKPIEHLATMSVLHCCNRNIKDSDLDFDDVFTLIFNNCFYCEKTPEEVGSTYRRPKDDGRSIKRIGIDRRVDSTKGYYKDNVVPCCKTCNYLKRDHGVLDLIERLELFLKNLKRIINK